MYKLGNDSSNDSSNHSERSRSNIPWTSTLFNFRRRRFDTIDDLPTSRIGAGPLIAEIKNGNSVGSPWQCAMNADCTFLGRGHERVGRLPGRESFNGTISAYGFQAGTGPGRVIVLDTMKELSQQKIAFDLLLPGRPPVGNLRL